MKAAAFDYVRPTSVAEALEHLERGAGDVALLAGGQTLMPLLSLRMARPSVIIDINRIADLQGVARSNGGMRIGAITRQNQAIAQDSLASVPALVKAMRHIGHFQTRNRGTVGGSIALGEPAAELPATAVALGAQIDVSSVNGSRLIPADEFYIGPYATTLDMDEMITAIHFPDWPTGTIEIFREVARRPGDFALVGLVGALTVDQGRVSRVGLAWFGMGPTPMKAVQAEQALLGQRISDLNLDVIAELAIADTDPFEDKHATAVYRRTVGRTVAKQVLGDALTKGVAA